MWYVFVRFYINHAEQTPTKQIKLGMTPNCSAIHETRNTVVMQLSSNSGNKTRPGMPYKIHLYFTSFKHSDKLISEMTSRKLHIGEVGGMLDRSPCGSGTAAIVTSNWYRGDFKIGSFNLLNLYLAD